MMVPGWKRSVASILFLFLFLSSIIFGVFLFIRTYEVVSFNGYTTITGLVVSFERRPLEGVEVSCGGSVNRTGVDGTFVLEGVHEGEVKVSFYKPGHHLLDIKWVAYPMSELKGPLGGSVNNISRDLELVLYREFRTEIPYGPYKNGSLDLVILRGSENGTLPESIQISNGTGFFTFALMKGRNRITVQGNGSFSIRSNSTGPVIRAFYPVGNEIDITGQFIELITEGVTEWSSNGSICLNLSFPKGDTTIMIESFDHNGKSLVTAPILLDKEKGQTLMDIMLPSGVYTIRISGKDVLDTYYADLPVIEYRKTNVTIILIPGGKDMVHGGLNVDGNYNLAALNIILGMIFLLGGVLALRNGSWFMMVTIAFLGFISNGIIPFFIDMNHVVSLLLLLLSMFIFKQERTRLRSRH